MTDETEPDLSLKKIANPLIVFANEKKSAFLCNINKVLTQKRKDCMMKRFRFIWTLLVTAMIVACTTDNDITADFDPGMSFPEGEGGTSASIGELTSFDVAVNKVALSETETYAADDEDILENNTFDDVISINYTGTSATVSGTIDGVTIETNGANVTVNSTAKGVRYDLSGSTTNGSFKIYSDKKFEINLNGVDITNPNGPAINSQSKKRTYINMVQGTANKLTDGTSYTKYGEEDMKGTIFGEGKLLFSGNGTLEIYANCKAGIASDDYVKFRPGNNIYVKSTASNGIKANDSIIVNGGVINVEVSGTAAKGLSSDGTIEINGGRTTVLTSGDGEWDDTDNEVKACAAVKCDSTFNMNNGELLLKSTGKGGKGISGDIDLNFNGGTVKVITTGKIYAYGQYANVNDPDRIPDAYKTSPKGIKADNNLNIYGGNIMVRCTGGVNSEGIESKNIMTVSGGTVQVYTYDDAINAANGLKFTGGETFCYATNNDAIDSNGTLTVSGGVVIAVGSTQPEGGFDCDNSTFTITGGTVIGIGGDTSTPTESACKQPAVILGGSNLSSGTYIALANSSGTNLFAFKLPRAYSQYTLLLSSPGLAKGSKCTVSSGATVSGGSSFNGFVTGAMVSGGNSLFSNTLSKMVTTSNYSGMGGGGGPMGGMMP